MQKVPTKTKLIIDTHHHWLPRDTYENIEKYLTPGDEVRESKTPSGMTTKIVYRDGAQMITLSPTRFNIAEQVKDMDEAGVTVSVLSIASWIGFVTPETSVLFNNETAKLAKENSRFVGLAHVAIGDKGAPEELDRAVKDLGLRGLCIGTHHNGAYPDERIYDDIYKKVSELNVPIFVHAANRPAGSTAVLKYDIARNLGRVFDHSLAALRIIYSDVLERFPNLRFVHGHLGGTLFSIKKRYFSKELLEVGGIPRKDYDRLLREHFFFDTAPSQWTKEALMCAVATLGADNIVLGSDYPVANDWMNVAVNSIEGLDISDEEKDKIFYKNAQTLYGIRS
jgi:predicted TIM-barrel fold metal-dependent hydrolase